MIAAAGVEDDFRGQHGPGQKGAAHGNDDAGADDIGGPGAQGQGDDPARGGVVHLGELLLGHNAQGQQGHGHIHEDGDHKAYGRGPAHGDHVLGPVSVNGGAFNADEHPDCVQHAVFDLIHKNGAAFRRGQHAAQKGVRRAGGNVGKPARPPEAPAENGPLEQGQHHHNEKEHRNDLGHGHQGVYKGGQGNAPQNQGVHQPNADERADHGRGCGAVPKEVKGGKTAQTGKKHDHISGVAGHGRNPHAPGRVKAHIIAKTFPGVAVGAGIDVGPAQGQLLENLGQAKHAHESYDPGKNNGQSAGALGHILGQIEHAAADHGTYDQRGQRK